MKLTSLLAYAFATTVFAGPTIPPLPVERQYEIAAHVVRAKALDQQSLSISNHLGIAVYSVISFDVLDEYKGALLVPGMSSLKSKTIVIACQTKLLELGPVVVTFDLGKEYVLFLGHQDPVHDSHLYRLVTDMAPSQPASSELIEKILNLRNTRAGLKGILPHGDRKVTLQQP